MISWIYYSAATLWESNMCVWRTIVPQQITTGQCCQQISLSSLIKSQQSFPFFSQIHISCVGQCVLKSWRGVNLLWKCKKKICPCFWRQKTLKTRTWDEHLQMNSSCSPLIYMSEWLNYLNALQSWWVNEFKTLAKNVIGKA